MPDDQRAGVTLVKILEQSPHRRLLRCRTRVGGLTTDVESSFVADADGVGIVVQTVGADHPFRPTGLDLSVTTDHVVVADAKLIMAVFAVPGINLSGRRCLVGLYCRTMNYYQCNNSHTCALYKMVQDTAPNAVRIADAMDTIICAINFVVSFLLILFSFLFYPFTFLLLI